MVKSQEKRAGIRMLGAARVLANPVAELTQQGILEGLTSF
jgi:hypothetical protein